MERQFIFKLKQKQVCNINILFNVLNHCWGKKKVDVFFSPDIPVLNLKSFAFCFSWRFKCDLQNPE